MVMNLTREDRALVGTAIAEARQKTGVEIRLVSMVASSHYGAFVLIYMLLAGLMAGIPPALLLPRLPAELVVTIEFAVALLALLALQNHWLRRQLVPNASLRKAAWRQARMTFAHLKLDAGNDKPVLLLFCSGTERYAEILTEQRVLAKAPPAVWETILADFRPHMQKGDMGAAFVHLVEKSAAALAPHFPN